MDPFLTFSDERDLREQVWRNYYNRGDNGDEYDNNAVIMEILRLRDERVVQLPRQPALRGRFATAHLFRLASQARIIAIAAP